MHQTLWFHCSNNISVLPGTALPLKVFILGVPKCNPDTEVLIRCPTSGFARAGLGDWGGGPWGTHPPSGHAGAGDGWLGRTHPPPLGKVTSGLSPLGLLLPEGFPQRVGWGLLGGCMQLMKCDLLAEIIHELMQLLVHKVAKLCLEVMWRAPTQVRVTSRWMRVTLPLLGQRLQFRRVTSHYGNICHYVMPRRSHNSNGNWFISQFHCLYAPPDAHWISSAMQNRATDYLYDVLLWHRVKSSRVPSFLITLNTHILVLRWGLLDGTLSLLEAVAEDEVDIFVFFFQLKVAMMLFVLSVR